MHKHIIIFFLLNHSLIYIYAKRVQGNLITTKNWIFLTRFCFLSDSGQLSYEIEFSKHLAPIHLLFYYDGPNQWNSVYKKNIPCDQAIKEPYLIRDNYQEVTLEDASSSNSVSGCKTYGELMRCFSDRTFEASRQRWWYIAIARCSNVTIQGLYLKYNLRMTNGKRHLTKELSADEFYILETSIGFILAFLTLFIIACKFANNLRQRLLLHTTYRMFLFSLILIVLSLVITCIAYGKFVKTGFEDYDLKVIGKAIMACSHVIFLFMLLLLGKGYNVTRGRLSQSSSLKIFVFLSVYSVIYIVLFFNDVFSDPGVVLYMYESIPGYGVIGLRIIAWIYFSFACFMTLKHYPEKKKFYYPLYAFYSVWFLIGPVFVLIALFGLESYHREKIVNGVDLAITFLAYLYLLYLTRPSHSNKNFPYHVRTSQVGIMEERSSMDDNINFKRNAYAPSTTATSTGPDFRNLFDVVRSVYSQNSTANNGNTAVENLRNPGASIEEKENGKNKSDGVKVNNTLEGNRSALDNTKKKIQSVMDNKHYHQFNTTEDKDISKD